MQAELEEAMRHRVYPITKRIGIGQFVTHGRAEYLRHHGYTHVLNVGEAESVVVPGPGGFQEVVDQSVEDLTRIPNDMAVRCLDALNRMLQVAGSKVYVHCVACQNRSPTIVWLYFLACGMGDTAAEERITVRCPDAVPGHTSLVDGRLLQLVREHGRRHFLPLHDANILEPAY